MADYEPQGEAGDAFEFTGTWREYLPIALSNLALTIVTLGIYRFWAKARTRRYLWSRTRFIDDKLEWTGTGKEMFIGFLMVAAILFLPLFLLNLWFQSLLLKGQHVMAVVVFAGLYFLSVYLAGFAQFRALRYRLARTWWHGIRGGAQGKGFRYGFSALWKPLVGLVTLGLLVPWSMTSLWNDRWNAMSFGPTKFVSKARFQPVMKSYLLFYLTPFLLAGLGMALVMTTGGNFGGYIIYSEGSPMFRLILLLVVFIALNLLVGLIALAFYAAYFRTVVGALSLGKLQFGFEASTDDWIKLILGDVLLVICTLGIGYIFIAYRHWSFFVRHLSATGEIDLSELTQSRALGTREAEGFADAFDVGAI